MSTTVLAQGKGGSVTASGHVTVDGKAVKGHGSIFTDEKLETERGNANMVTDGTTTVVDDKTSLMLHDNYLDLDCGRVRVVTVRGFAVHVRDAVLTPMDGGQTRFEVAQGARKVDIHALQGRLEIARNKTTSTLLPGQTREIEDEANCAALGAFDWKPIPAWAGGVALFYIPYSDNDDDVSPFKP